MVSQESAANSCEASTLGGLLLSFTFESGDGRWNLGKIVICSVYVLIYSAKLLQEVFTLSFQFGFVPSNGSLGIS